MCTYISITVSVNTIWTMDLFVSLDHNVTKQVHQYMFESLSIDREMEHGNWKVETILYN